MLLLKVCRARTEGRKLAAETTFPRFKETIKGAYRGVGIERSWNVGEVGRSGAQVYSLRRSTSDYSLEHDYRGWGLYGGDFEEGSVVGWSISASVGDAWIASHGE